MALRFQSTTPRRASLLAIALTLPLAIWLQPAARSATVLSYISSPASWVGQGESATISSEGGFDIVLTAHDRNAVFFWINNYQNPDSVSWQSWGLNAYVPESLNLTTGTHFFEWGYENGSESQFHFSGNGRGNNSASGSFQVLEAGFADDGSLQSFALDFLQYDNRIESAWIKGALRFNSSVPIVLTPEPITYPVIESGLILDPLPMELPPLPGTEPEVEIDPIVISEITPRDFLPLPWEGGEEIPIYYSSGSSISNSVGEIQVIYTLEEPVNAVPAPLPLAGALAVWQSARRLRSRCQAAKARTTA